MTKPITTTLNAILCDSQYDDDPCEHILNNDWERLLMYLGKTEADNEPLKFSTIIEGAGINTAYNCLPALSEEHEPSILKLLVDVTERILPFYEKEHPKDLYLRDAIRATRD